MFLPTFLLFTVGCFNSVQVAPALDPSNPSTTMPATSFHALEAIDINGNTVSMSSFAGKKVMVVNTASECGFTPQYKQLQELHEAYKNKGLVILGFPCNDFGGQEPGTGDEIEAFCQKNYGVTFPLMAKVDVNGDQASPLFDWMKGEAPGLMGSKSIKWNFTKFLINREGEVVKRYAPQDTPERIAKDIEGLL